VERPFRRDRKAMIDKPPADVEPRSTKVRMASDTSNPDADLLDVD
jgi:hypothetical protein